MKELFDFILLASVNASIAGMVILFLKILFQNKLSALWHYSIWSILLIKLIIPLGPESPVSIFNAVTFFSPNTASHHLSNGSKNNFSENEKLKQGSLSTYTPILKTTLDKAKKKSQNPISPPSVTWSNYVPYIWIVIVAFLLGLLTYTNYSFRRQLKTRNLTTDENLKLLLQKCKHSMGVKKNISLEYCPMISTPALFGLIHPKILLPLSVSNLHSSELEYILLHELAHYKRKDIFVNYILILFNILHWFNPAIWYYFKKLRADMEIATDDKVLKLLTPEKHKEYGKAILSILQSFNSSKFVPKFIGMLDNRKNIERRIQLIKKARYVKHRKRLTIFVSTIFIFTLSGILLTSATTYNKLEMKSVAVPVKESLKYDTTYIGSNVKLKDILASFPYAQNSKGFSVQKNGASYSITVNYSFDTKRIDYIQMPKTFDSCFNILISLIKNVNKVSFNYKYINGKGSNIFGTGQPLKGCSRDLRDYNLNPQIFSNFLNTIGLKVTTSPKNYSPAMSSTPGIKLNVTYCASDYNIRYSSQYGQFLTWDIKTGKITEYGQTVTLPANATVYWTPLRDKVADYDDHKASLDITILDKANKVLVSKHIKL